MPIDLAAVNWPYVGILSLLAFVAALLGSLISFRNKFTAAIIAGILFGVGFIFWTYYPHENIPGPTSIGPVAAPAPAPTAAAPPPAASPIPANPVTTKQQ